MRRGARGLFAKLITPAWLGEAIDQTARGKHDRPDVAALILDWDRVLPALVRTLAAGIWRPVPPRLLWVRGPKPRLIARSPVADRVVHTALVELLWPVFGRRLVAGDFACRRHFGTHRAVLRLQEHMRRNTYAVHLDVRSFFASVDLEILAGLVAERVADDRFLATLQHVLEVGRGLFDNATHRRFARMDADWPPPGRGLPLGASTSQFLATHVYLLAFDHWVKRVLKVPGYVRYVDDVFLFGRRRGDLRAWREATAEWLWRERSLRWKHPEAPVISTRCVLDGLGYRITRAEHWARPRVARRARGRVAAAFAGRPGPKLSRSLASSVGFLTF